MLRQSNGNCGGLKPRIYETDETYCICKCAKLTLGLNVDWCNQPQGQHYSASSTYSTSYLHHNVLLSGELGKIKSFCVGYYTPDLFMSSCKTAA